jgi:hypothetical protein
LESGLQNRDLNLGLNASKGGNRNKRKEKENTI